MTSTCVFCKIITGELPSDMVAETDRFVAFCDIQPLAETHVLVVPRDHHDHLDSYVAASDDQAEMLRFITDTAKELGIGGRYRLVTNVGSAAGQVVHHLHWHLMAGPDLPGFH